MMPEMTESRSIRELVADVVTIGLAIPAVFLAGFLVWERTLGGQPDFPRRNLVNREIPEWEDVVREGRRIGPERASVTVVVFGDYECPFCKKADQALRALAEEYPGEIAVVFRHYPLKAHGNAYPAARVADCGARHGRFEAVHFHLFDASDLESLDLETIGEAAGIQDIPGFLSCAQDPGPVDQVELDLAVARALDLTAVPAIILEGTLLGPTPDSTGLSEILHDRLPAAQPGENFPNFSRQRDSPW
jgi:thiol-disulfide isomerase/thioredoxin